jgi:hypothetical protein
MDTIYIIQLTDDPYNRRNCRQLSGKHFVGTEFNASEQGPEPSDARKPFRNRLLFGLSCVLGCIGGNGVRFADRLDVRSRLEMSAITTPNNLIPRCRYIQPINPTRQKEMKMRRTSLLKFQPPKPTQTATNEPLSHIRHMTLNRRPIGRKVMRIRESQHRLKPCHVARSKYEVPRALS